jgi:hypothetical protein
MLAASIQHDRARGESDAMADKRRRCVVFAAVPGEKIDITAPLP